jgi:ribosomal protein L7/L12
MATVEIHITDNDGFTSTFTAQTASVNLLRGKVQAFLDTALTVQEYKLDISHLNTAYQTATSGYKIPAIKAVRTATALGLKEAKDIVDQLGAGPLSVITLLTNLTKDQAENAKAFLTPHFQVDIVAQ